MRKIWLILVAMMLLMSISVMATRQIRWTMTPCVGNIDNDSRVMFNLSIGACDAGFNWDNLWQFDRILGGTTWGTEYTNGLFKGCFADVGCPYGNSLKGAGFIGIINPLGVATCSDCNPYYQWYPGGTFFPVTPNYQQQLGLYCHDIKYRIVINVGAATERVIDWSDWVTSFQAKPLWTTTTDDAWGGLPGFNLSFDSTTNANWKLDDPGTYMIRIEAFDTGNFTVDEWLINYTVSADGFGYGECYSSNTNAYEFGIDNDPFTKAFSGLGGGFTKGLIWGILMLLVGAIIFFTGKGMNSQLLLLMVGVVEVLMLFIGTYLHLIPWIFLVLILIAIIIFVGLKFKDIIS